MDVYHKEQLVTKEEAEKVASNEKKWGEVASNQDVLKRIIQILKKHKIYVSDNDCMHESLFCVCVHIPACILFACTSHIMLSMSIFCQLKCYYHVCIVKLVCLHTLFVYLHINFHNVSIAWHPKSIL